MAPVRQRMRQPAGVTNAARLSEIADQHWYGECHDPSGDTKDSHKFYRILRVGTVVLKLYGRLPGYGGKRVITTCDVCGSVREAENIVNAVRHEKSARHGYVSSTSIPTEVELQTAMYLKMFGGGGLGSMPATVVQAATEVIERSDHWNARRHVEV